MTKCDLLQMSTPHPIKTRLERTPRKQRRRSPLIRSHSMPESLDKLNKKKKFLSTIGRCSHYYRPNLEYSLAGLSLGAAMFRRESPLMLPFISIGWYSLVLRGSKVAASPVALLFDLYNIHILCSIIINIYIFV